MAGQQQRKETLVHSMTSPKARRQSQLVVEHSSASQDRSAPGTSPKLPPHRLQQLPLRGQLDTSVKLSRQSVFLLDRAQPVFFGKTKENGGVSLPGSPQQGGTTP